MVKKEIENTNDKDKISISAHTQIRMEPLAHSFAFISSVFVHVFLRNVTPE